MVDTSIDSAWYMAVPGFDLFYTTRANKIKFVNTTRRIGNDHCQSMIESTCNVNRLLVRESTGGVVEKTTNMSLFIHNEHRHDFKLCSMDQQSMPNLVCDIPT